MASPPTNTSATVPRREDLIAQIETANRWGWTLLWIQGIAIVGLIALIDWPAVLDQPLISTVAIAAVAGPFTMSILRHWAKKKKEIGDLKEQTRFGEFDKHQLRKLFQETLRSLRLPETPIPVYIVADKFMNAFMLHVGLGSLFKSLNGIYLNRQTLHKLNAKEVQDIMGHELGHYYKYFLISDRFRLVTLGLGVLIAIFVVQLLGFTNFLSLIVLMTVSGAIWSINAWHFAKHIWAIEYLCDDLGAHVHGVGVSIAGLMKLGVQWEVVTAIQQQATFSANRGNLSAFEVVEAIEAAIPYGHTSHEELQAAVEKSLRSKASEGASVAGFLRYMWQSDADAEADELFEEEMKKLKKLQGVPRIPWEQLLEKPSEIYFDDDSLETLVELIEQFPEAALFHTPEAIGEGEALHPPLKDRIRYLWYNRQEIAADSIHRAS